MNQLHRQAAIKPMKSIAFHLPQFHPFRENDEWWGKGFTEWTNVAKARPRFPWHQQPHLPADLGFYDLRLPEARAAQAELAREYGIGAFCYYHYWFNGRRVLNLPVDEILRMGEPDFPFCLCWANENWTRTWDGGDHEILLGQAYGVDDDRNHIKFLSRVFTDERYLRVNGKPVFLVYRASRLPDPRRTTDIWREESQRLGVGDLYLCLVESFPTEHGRAKEWGFDAAVEFAPDWTSVGPRLRQGVLWDWLWKKGIYRSPYVRDQVFSYPEMVRRMLSKPDPEYRRFRCVTPMWDNCARRQRNAVVFRDSSPELYERWLTEIVRRESAREDEQIVFINAWNEWAEGNHLEPCQRWGRQYLEATKRALNGSGSRQCVSSEAV